MTVAGPASADLAGADDGDGLGNGALPRGPTDDGGPAGGEGQPETTRLFDNEIIIPSETEFDEVFAVLLSMLILVPLTGARINYRVQGASVGFFGDGVDLAVHQRNGGGWQYPTINPDPVRPDTEQPDASGAERPRCTRALRMRPAPLPTTSSSVEGPA
jgi:hypothetical protein